VDAHELLELALVNYLAGLNDGQVPPKTLWPPALVLPDGNTERIFAGQSDQDKDGMTLACIADESQIEDPYASGNFWIPVTVSLRTSCQVNAPDETDVIEDGDPDTDLKAHKAAQSVLMDATLRDEGELAQLLTAAVPGAFTCFGIKEFNEVRLDGDGDCWESGVKFMALCCARKC